MNRLFISAAHKSSGKTTLSIGLCAALTTRGHVVQPFKKGPDYIDPLWLGLACARPCHNLDFFLMQHEEIQRAFLRQGQDADLAVVEGNKGLYDGLDLDGSNSNAALAKLLRTPVILVIDARGMTRGVAPLILGYQAFDPEIHIAGIILNQLGGARHERKLRAVIEHYTNVPVVGAVQHNDEIAIVERHLGLIPSNELSAARDKILSIARSVEAQVDLDLILSIAGNATSPSAVTERPAHIAEAGPVSGNTALPPVRIGVARDAAFAFYYPGDLEALERHGAELQYFDTLHDSGLPEVDALLIGGGFPETHMHALEKNLSLRTQIREAIERDMPVYAECGGLMYLTRGLTWRGERCEMVGALPGETRMHDRPQGRGYVVLRETGRSLWPHATRTVDTVEIRCHEFHYSSIEGLPDDSQYAFTVVRGHGFDGKRDGLLYRNVLASYSHMRDVEGNPWTGRFVAFIRQAIQNRKPSPMNKPMIPIKRQSST